jgi:hypothetical protein
MLRSTTQDKNSTITLDYCFRLGGSECASVAIYGLLFLFLSRVMLSNMLWYCFCLVWCFLTCYGTVFVSCDAF